MKYKNIKSGIFLSRPNRFIANVEIDGAVITCHVKNTGRCRELLIPGVTVYIEKSDNPARKTGYSLIGVKKGERLINMDSQAPNKAVQEWILNGYFLKDIISVKAEKSYGESRFDFYIETTKKKIFMEVKGVTLEEEGVVMFPDAPTTRGVKHLKELCKCVKEGYEAYILFVIQMDNVAWFQPNNRTHPEFGEALKEAKEQGVHILAMDCVIEEDSMALNKPVPVLL